MERWECYSCGYVHDGEPPESCPKCGRGFWVAWFEAKSPLGVPVRAYMRTDFPTIDANESAWDAAKLMKEKNTGSLIVTVNREPKGIVTERDMLYKIVAADLPPAHIQVHKIMSTPLITVDAETPIRKALEIMTDRHIRHLLVSDNGKTVGLVTQRAMIGETVKPAGSTSQLEPLID
jgi:CBS domain-containing protein